MTIEETELPLKDVLQETAWGIESMNRSLEKDNADLSATQASVSLSFMASLSRGQNYREIDHDVGGIFTFWLIGGAGAGSYNKTELNQYYKYSERISIDVEVTFEPLGEEITS